jgi:hypothetical protein
MQSILMAKGTGSLDGTTLANLEENLERVPSRSDENCRK